MHRSRLARVGYLYPTTDQATYVLLLHNAEVELWAESSIDVICDALLELADTDGKGPTIWVSE
jgi:hypothetical protein